LPEGYENGVAFSPDGRRFAVSRPTKTDTGEAEILDAATGKVLVSLVGVKNRPRVLSFTPDGRSLVTASVPDGRSSIWDHKPNEVQVWDATTGRERYQIAGIKGYVHDVACSPDGRLLAGASTGTVLLWEAETGKLRRAIPLKAPARQVKFHPDGRHLLVAAADGALYVLRVNGASK
jgi:WD40 repeat protein